MAMTETDELIKRFLERGGKITQCAKYNPYWYKKHSTKPHKELLEKLQDEKS